VERQLPRRLELLVLGAGGGGDFDWQYMGIAPTGGLGIGSTNTYYSSPDNPTTATVEVSIGSVEESKTVNCT
jgi:hypothetical protein